MISRRNAALIGACGPARAKATIQSLTVSWAGMEILKKQKTPVTTQNLDIFLNQKNGARALQADWLKSIRVIFCYVTQRLRPTYIRLKGAALARLASVVWASRQDFNLYDKERFSLKHHSKIAKF